MLSDTLAVDSERPTVTRRVWLADLTYTQQQISSELIPQAIGGIATYAESRGAFEHPIKLFKYPEALAEALAAEGCPEVIGFSSYVWNTRLSSAFAKRIRAMSPDTVIVFGGPHYPVTAPEQEAFLANRPEIDFFVVKEGEVGFFNLLSALARPDSDVERVKALGLASVHAIGRDGRAFLNQAVERVRDLTEIPSPYVSGKLDSFFDGKLLPIIQTNRGCPFNCTFCVEGLSYYNKIYRNSADKVQAEISYIGRKMVEVRSKGGRNDLFIADSNFGMYRDDLLTCKEIAKAQDQYGWPEYINVATGKNQKERVLEAARLVRGALRLSGSVQSLDPQVLENVKRKNIAGDELMRLALEAAEIDANSYSEVILGLPGDTKVAHYKTLGTIIESGFRKVIPYTLMMLPGSEMCSEESKAEHGMILRYRVLPRCFGYFDVCGERIVCAEVEEVCVGTNTLPYGDYLACRKMHLMVSIFYNDGVFGGVLKFLQNSGVSTYRWLLALSEAKLSDDIRPLVEGFEEATRNELFETRAALESFCDDPGVIERYIEGELGRNLLFTYKSVAMTRYVGALLDLARQTVAQVLAESGLDTATNLRFVDNILAYDAGRMTNVFDGYEEDVSVEFDFDVVAYLDAAEPPPVETLRLQESVGIDFVLNERQTSTIERGLRLFGSDDVAIGLILSKFHVTKLLRQPVTTGAAADAIAQPRSETGVTINIHDS
jgi:radical SAM superfamily enzyme YgiQ (UPF0313 family)